MVLAAVEDPETTGAGEYVSIPEGEDAPPPANEQDIPGLEGNEDSDPSERGPSSDDIEHLLLLDDAPPAPPAPSAPSPTRRKRVVVDEEEESPREVAPPQAPLRRFVWLALRQDLAVVSADRACSPASQQAGDFSCFRANGTQYLGTPADTIGASSGILLATTRLVVGYEHFFSERFALAGWIGLVLQGGAPRSVGEQSSSFLPLHLELETTWWPSAAPERAQGVAPFFSLGGGVAQIDAHFRQNVVEDPTIPPPIAQPDNPPSQSLDAYKKSGTGFLSFGGGFVVSSNELLVWRAGLECLVSFPAPGFTLALEAGLGFDL